MTLVSPPPRHERTLRALRVGLAPLTTISSVVLLGFSMPAAASGILPGANPPANITPAPNFTSSGTCTTDGTTWQCDNPCVTPELAFPVFTSSASCARYVVSAVTAARKHEKVRAMVLPTDFSHLGPREQLFVLADLERVDRGLPPYVGLNAALSKEAGKAAKLDEDPTLAPGFNAGVDASGAYGMGGAWSTGFSTLVADYFWMYSDGWGGSKAATSNAACTSATAPGCWAHRDELLGYDPRFNPGVGLHCKTCEMGTGFAIVDGHTSMTDLVELPAGRPPKMTFTWKHDVVPYLPHTGATSNAHASRAAGRDPLAPTTWTPWGASRACGVPLPSPVREGCHQGLQPAGQIARSSRWEE